MNDRRIGAPRQAAAERGGFAVGLVIGLLIGLAVALGVALYITKVPIPFINKVPQRTAGQDAAEAERNKDWDPNRQLYGKNPAKGSTAASGTLSAGETPAVPTAPAAPPSNPATIPTVRASAPSNTTSTAANATTSIATSRDPAAILADRPAGAAPKVASTLPAANTNAGAANGTTTSTSPSFAAGSDPFTYFVQAGAYGRTEEADQQRARLAMMGLEGKTTEREQSGRTVYRVRVGPFDSRADADAAKDRLAAAGVEAALVRVQR